MLISRFKSTIFASQQYINLIKTSSSWGKKGNKEKKEHLSTRVSPNKTFYSTSAALTPLSHTEPSISSKLTNFMCNSSQINDHTNDDVGLMHEIPSEVYRRMVSPDFNTKHFSLKFQHFVRSVGEACIVIRKPGVELVNYLKNTDYDAPVNRYIIYGPNGSGKTSTLQYVTHYCMQQGWLIVPNPACYDWMKYTARFKADQRLELIESSWNKERVDVPQRSVNWLKVFQLTNGELLNNIKTTKDYAWSKHETSPAGTSFAALVTLGQARVRIANDIIGAIMREVRVQDKSSMPKTLVAVDAVNVLFAMTKLSMQHNVLLLPSQLSYVHNLKKLLSSTWNNGAVVTATSSASAPFFGQMPPRKGSHPFDLLGSSGFDWMDPHIPIKVEQYTDREVLSQLAYYKHKKVLQGKALTEAGEGEIIQLSCYNPSDLFAICSYAY